MSRSNNPFAQDIEQQVIADSTGTPPLGVRPSDPSIMEERTIQSTTASRHNSTHSSTHSSTSPSVPLIRVETDQPHSTTHDIPHEEHLPTEAPPAYSEVDPNPSPMASPLLSAQQTDDRPPVTPPRPVSSNGESYQRPAAPPPLHLNTDYYPPPGPPPSHYQQQTSPQLPARPVSPRLPPRRSSQFPGRTGATYNGAQLGPGRPPLPQRRY